MLIGMPASLMPVQHGFSRHTTSHPTLRGAALHTLYGGWLPPARDAAFMLSTTRTCMFQMVAFATCWMLPETYLRLLPMLADRSIASATHILWLVSLPWTFCMLSPIATSSEGLFVARRCENSGRDGLSLASVLR